MVSQQPSLCRYRPRTEQSERRPELTASASQTLGNLFPSLVTLIISRVPSNDLMYPYFFQPFSKDKLEFVMVQHKA